MNNAILWCPAIPDFVDENRDVDKNREVDVSRNVDESRERSAAQ